MFDLYVFSTSGSNRVRLRFAKIKERYSHAKLLVYTGTIVDMILKAKSKTLTPMFWVLDIEADIVDNFDFSMKPDSWDQQYIHVWPTANGKNIDQGLSLWPRKITLTSHSIIEQTCQFKIMDQVVTIIPEFDIFVFAQFDCARINNRFAHIKRAYPTAKLIVSDRGIINQVSKAITETTTKMFTFFDIDYDIKNVQILKPELWDYEYIHVLKSREELILEECVVLWPSDRPVIYDEFSTLNFNNIKFTIIADPHIMGYDIIFLSSIYNTRIQCIFDILKTQYPISYTIAGYTNINELHSQIRHMIPDLTKMFWLIDIDNIIDPQFNLLWKPDVWDQQYMHIWGSLGDNIFDCLSLWPSDIEQKIKDEYTVADIKYMNTTALAKVSYELMVFSKSNADNVMRRFNLIKKSYPDAILLVDYNDLNDLIRSGKSFALSKMFWLLNIDYDLDPAFDIYWQPTKWDQQYVHLWGKSGDSIFKSLSLWPSDIKQEIEDEFTVANIKIIDSIPIFPTPFDIFVYTESNSDSVQRRFKMIKDRYENAQLIISDCTINNVISNAKSFTTTCMFWLFNIEYDVLDNFDITWMPTDWDRRYVHMWLSGNQNIMQGLSLWPSDISQDQIDDYTINNTKIFDEVAVKVRQYDLFLISYNVYDDRIQAKFDKIRDVYPDSNLIFVDSNIITAVMTAQDLSRTKMFWILDIEAELCFDLAWRPYAWEQVWTHVWLSENGKVLDQGLSLWPTDGEYIDDNINNMKFIDTVATKYGSYDIFFLSYNEPNADINYNELLKVAPHAQRVDGIKGIHNAHKRCAELSSTEMFWTIDADTVIDSDFNLTFRPSLHDKQYLHLWYTRNPVNDLVYGYGAIKLWPRIAPLSHEGNWLDFTTSVGNIKIIDKVVSTTHFNSSEYDAWRSGFREAVKLAYNLKLGDRSESLDRLLIWLNKANDVQFAINAKAGARHGLDYFVSYGHDKDLLKSINDFSWLKVRHKYIVDTVIKMPSVIEREDLLEMLEI